MNAVSLEHSDGHALKGVQEAFTCKGGAGWVQQRCLLSGASQTRLPPVV